MVLKLDLVKAYDLVDCAFLRLLLLNGGLDLLVTNWILGCITSVNFAVLINGCPTTFFKGSRGLRQSFPLSPLLFLLVIEGLSRLLNLARDTGKIIGIKVSKNYNITHVLYVDDVLLFGIGIFDEWVHYKQILDIFYNATGMIISIPNSCIFHMNLTSSNCDRIGSLFPYDVKELEGGIKYLGYTLKPNAYSILDWQ